MTMAMAVDYDNDDGDDYDDDNYQTEEHKNIFYEHECYESTRKGLICSYVLMSHTCPYVGNTNCH